MTVNAKAVWVGCGVWALFFVLGGSGAAQGGHLGSGLAFMALGVLPGLAVWARSRMQEVSALSYWGAVAAMGAALLLLGGGLPWWVLLVVIVGAAGLWVWVQEAKPTGAYAARWLTTGEAAKFNITQAEEAVTLPAAVVPALRSVKANNAGLIGLKPYTVSSIQGELGHLTVVAPTRSGKGLLLTAHLLSWNGSLIVLDIKGENWTKTSAYRATLGPVHVLNPEGRGARFDPIAELLELGSDAETALLQAAHIILKPHEEQQPIYPLKAVPALRAGMRVAHALREPVLPWVYAMSRGGMRAYVQGVQAHAKALDDWTSVDDLTEYLDRPLSEVKEELWGDARWLPAQSWSNLTTSLGRVCTAGVLAMTSGRDFKAAELKQRPASLYLIWREDMGDGVRDVFSLVALALTRGMGRYADDHQGQPMQQVLMIVDEAGVFQVPELPRLMATLAGRGIWLSPYFQNTAQMRELYGDEGDQTIIGNSSAVVWYPSPEKSAAEYVEQMAGKTSVEVQSVGGGTTWTYGGGSGNAEGMPLNLGGLSRSTSQTVNRSMTDRPLISASDFAQLGDNAVLVQYRNHPWVRAEPVRWFALPHLKARAAERGVNGEPIGFSLNAYRSRLTPTPQRQYAEPAASTNPPAFYKPDEN